MPPYLSAALEPLPLTVVEVTELAAPNGGRPLHWRLLTSLPVTTLTAAVTVIGYYQQRWQVERFHFVLKRGCRGERLQLAQAERLKRAVLPYSQVAWRVLQLQGAATVVADDAWQAATAFVHQGTPAADPPSLVDFTALGGRLGGHLGRPEAGAPGLMTLGRGWARLADLIDFWQMLHDADSSPVRTTGVPR